MRDLMRYPRPYREQRQQHLKSPLREQRPQQQLPPVSASNQKAVSPAPLDNTTPLHPKPQPSPLRQEQKQTHIVQQHQQQQQQQQKQQQQQQQQRAPTTATGVGKTVASTATPQQSAPYGKGVPGSQAVVPPKPGHQKLMPSPKITRVAFDILLANRVGVQWAQDMVEKLAFDFDKADKDKNGSLSVDEVIQVLKSVGFKGSNEEAKVIFAHLDKNKDNKISRDEFKSSLIKLPRMSLREFAYRKAFLSLDKDQSGFLSKAEVEDAVKADATVPIAADKISDILIYLTRDDDDQKVSYDEFLEVLGFEESASICKKIFQLLDKDNSGFLTRVEISTAIFSEGELANVKPKLLQLLDDLVKDADQKINYHEFVESWLKKKAEVKQARKA
ncbi:calcium-dependent protein kinase [Plakobranchus ocellatus]|uniref:Calcium-dependent protein kinase n=1 Tax=Plakobranchus ocellatus TaxID=259542 RepID=A0AAV3ZZ18_9GAST|nr:calcium-dependent protein kinase [Plakobranchus ocellatus]